MPVQQLGHYVLEQELARGGAGAVHRARDLRTGAPVAIKLLHGAHPTGVRRFRREAEALLRLQHPGIVAVHEVGQAPGRAFLVMDLVEGPSLQQRIDRGGPLPVTEAVELTRVLAEALAVVHAAGLVHRDVKPSNVLLRDEREPLLTDFGLVKDLDPSATRLTKTGLFLGTPGFWPPEQARGRLDQVGPRSDLYSLGATLFAALTGRPPFVGETLVDYITSAEREPPPPPSRFRREVDPALDRICLWCLERRVEDRPASAEVLAQALADYRPRARGRLALLAGGLVVAAGAGALGLAALGSGPPPGPTPLAQASRPSPSRPSPSRPSPSRPSPSLRPDPPGSPPGPPASTPARGGAEQRLAELRERYEARDFPAAEAMARELLAESEGAERSEPLRWLSKALLQLGQTQLALERAREALQLAPRDSELVTLEATALLVLGRKEEALACYDRALRYDRTNARGYAARALVRMDLAQLDGALADAEAALRLDPDYVEAHVLRGRVFAQRGALEGAVLAFDEALRRDPTHVNARFNRGHACMGLERFEEAERDLSEVIQRSPRFLPGYTTRGLVRDRRGNSRGALADYRAALALCPAGAPVEAQLKQLIQEHERRLGERR